MAAFHTIAEYYEVLSDSEARLRREGPFLAECLERAPGRRVLDVACGTGLHAEFFANLGAEVAALDLSAEMIAHARERRPHPAIHYAAGDMREPPTGPWDLAVCLGNSLSLLEAAGQSLTPGPTHQYYKRTVTLWEVDEPTAKKHAAQGYHFAEDKRVIEEAFEKK